MTAKIGILAIALFAQSVGAYAQVCPPNGKLVRKGMKKEVLKAGSTNSNNVKLSPSDQWRVGEDCSGNSGCVLDVVANQASNANQSFTLNTSSRSAEFSAFDEQSGTYSAITFGREFYSLDLRTQKIKEYPFPYNSAKALSISETGKYAVIESKPNLKTNSIDLFVVDIKTNKSQVFPNLQNNFIDESNQIFYGIDSSNSLVAYSIKTGKMLYSENFANRQVKTVSKPDANGDIMVVAQNPATHVIQFNLNTKNSQKSSVANTYYPNPVFYDDRPIDVVIDYRPMPKDTAYVVKQGRSVRVQDQTGAPSQYSALQAFAGSADNSLIAFKSLTGTVVVADMNKGLSYGPKVFNKKVAAQPPIPLMKPVSRLRADPPSDGDFIDETHLILGFEDRLSVFDPTTGKEKVVMKKKKKGYAFHPEPRTASSDPLVSKWKTIDDNGDLVLITIEFKCSTKGSLGKSTQSSGGSGSSGVQNSAKDANGKKVK